MTTFDAVLPAPHPSIIGRVAAALLTLIEVRYARPSGGDGEHPDDETMMQVALICSAHF